MTNIKWIEIDNFRGVSHIRYEPKQVNLLIGRNNSGKTTILDAIYGNLNGSLYDNDYYNDYEVKIGAKSAVINSDIHETTLYAVNSQIPEQVLSNIDTILEEAVHAVCDEMKLSDIVDELYEYLRNTSVKYISVYDGMVNLIFDSGNHTVGDSEQLTEFQKIFHNSTKLTQKTSNNIIVQTSLSNVINDYNDSIDSQRLIARSGNNSIHIKLVNRRIRRQSIDFLWRVQSYINERQIISSEIVTKIDDFDKTNSEFDDEVRLIDVEKILKEYNIIPDLERITSKNVIYHSDSGNLLPQIPYYMHGDGFITLVRILYTIKYAENGVLLIEEPENHMHPGYLSVFVEQIMALAEKLNIQVFMTTHSYDLINELARYPVTEKESNMIQISNIVRRNGEHEIYNHSPSDAFNTIDKLMIDLRGT